MKTTRRRGLRLAAGLSALTLGTFALTTPAFAANDPVYGDIDPAHAGSITLHKHEFQAGTGDLITADPQGTSDALPNPIAGIQFTAYKLTDFDVENSTDWADLSETTVPEEACETPSLAGWTLGQGIDFAPTDADGETTLLLNDGASDELGAYLICEADNPEIDRKAAPFIVTVPFPDNQEGAPSNSNGWLYNVHAYPKNTRVVDVQKTVNSQVDLGLGETAKFPVTTGIPRIADDAQFTSYTVVDPFDPRLTDRGVESVQVAGVDVDPNFYSVEHDRNVVMVQFNQAGLTWLKTQGGNDVVTVFKGKVSSLESPGFGLEDGKIVNKAYLVTDHETLEEPPTTPDLPPLTPPGDDPVDPDDPFDPEGPPTVPSNKVYTNWGDIKIFKQDAQETGGTPAGLSGAVFEVYEAETPYPQDGVCAKDIAAGATPIEVSGETEFESDAGEVLIAGLFVSDSENAPVNAAERCYVVKEITAPAGYVLPTGDEALNPIAVTIGQTSGHDIVIDNVKHEVPQLPLTGAQGQLLLFLFVWVR